MLCPTERMIEDERAATARRMVKSQDASDDQPKSGSDDQPESGEREAEEVRPVRAPPIPDTPSREEVATHRLTHRPFRSWCPHCIRGKGRADQHRQSPNKNNESSIPRISSDYFFIGRRRPMDRRAPTGRGRRRERRTDPDHCS